MSKKKAEDMGHHSQRPKKTGAKIPQKYCRRLGKPANNDTRAKATKSLSRKSKTTKQRNTQRQSKNQYEEYSAVQSPCTTINKNTTNKKTSQQTKTNQTNSAGESNQTNEFVNSATQRLDRSESLKLLELGPQSEPEAPLPLR